MSEEELELEKMRILLIFEKEKYTNEQKKWFLESKTIDAKKNNDVLLIKLYDELYKMID